MEVFFELFPIFFFIVFALILGVFVTSFVGIIKRESRNNHSPRLTVPVTIVSKRTHVSVHHHGGDTMHHHSSTYYVTFQVSSGDRMELQVAGNEYGFLVEGDRGNLTFQGTRFLDFERT